MYMYMYIYYMYPLYGDGLKPNLRSHTHTYLTSWLLLEMAVIVLLAAKIAAAFSSG